MDIVVINLGHRPDKLQLFNANKQLGLPGYHRFPGVYVQDKDYKRKYPIDARQYGCYESHRRIWEKVDRPTLVLEDDAKLTRPYHIPDLPPDFDLFYLGCNWKMFGAKSGPRRGHYNEPGGQRVYIHEARQILTTHAYIISPQGAKKALAMDHYKLCVDMALWEVMKDGLSRYIKPSLFVQRAGHSDIHGKYINFEGIT